MFALLQLFCPFIANVFRPLRRAGHVGLAEGLYLAASFLLSAATVAWSAADGFEVETYGGEEVGLLDNTTMPALRAQEDYFVD